MAHGEFPYAVEKMSWAVDLCFTPSEAGFRAGEKPAALYFFPTLELEGATIHLVKP